MGKGRQSGEVRMGEVSGQFKKQIKLCTQHSIASLINLHIYWMFEVNFCFYSWSIDVNCSQACNKRLNVYQALQLSKCLLKLVFEL